MDPTLLNQSVSWGICHGEVTQNYGALNLCKHRKHRAASSQISVCAAGQGAIKGCQ